ncbi:DUF3558 family protein [Gordonia alkanivorans]|uniref:DUF3558 family protein n=2 Tax=Gordonia alkanivorans TaxID=84096 RepID=UPI0012F4DEA7|nr:DUF3558 family protein [Gordonia alkanivorans]
MRCRRVVGVNRGVGVGRRFWKLALIPVVAVLGVTMVACDVEGVPSAQPEAVASVSSSAATEPIRQTDDAGKRLPFDTEFPDRWSRNNDGTTYEPCTAVDYAQVRAFGLDPATVEDVAASNHQTARGCQWDLLEGDEILRPSLSQFVGNLTGMGVDNLKDYKQLQSTEYNEWLDDVVISGRTVVVSVERGSCDAFVQSGSAVVVTTMRDLLRDGPGVNLLCEKALGFVRLTIDKMPP